MNIKQMRRIDLYAGGGLCLILEIWERVRRLFFRNSPSLNNPEKILVTKYLGIGSILLATPMLRRLRAEYPQSRIVFLTFDSNARFAEQIPLIDEVLSIRTSSFLYFAEDLVKILHKIRNERFDAVFDLEFFPRFSTIVSYISGAPVRVGYYLPNLWRGNLLTHQIHFNPHKHVTEVLAAQLDPFGIKVTDFSLTPPKLKGDNIRKIGLLLKDRGLKEDELLIAVNVNASDLSIERRWPKESFAELINYIAQNKKDVKIVLVGSKGEAGYVRSVYDLLPEGARDKVINLAGVLDIEEFIALLNKSTLFITNDSGPLHIAAALGIPAVSFFGPESPSFYGPVGTNNTVFYAGIYCSPCLNVYNAKTAMCNGDNRCMKEISVEEVKKVLRDKGLIN